MIRKAVVLLPTRVHDVNQLVARSVGRVPSVRCHCFESMSHVSGLSISQHA